MKPGELLEEISRLPLIQRVEIAVAVLESVHEEEGGNPEVHNTEEKRAPLKRLSGLIKFEGDPPTDEEIKNMITDYLSEKYS